LEQRKKDKIYSYIVVVKQKNRRIIELSGLILCLIFILLLINTLIQISTFLIIYILISIATIGLFTNSIIQYKKGSKLNLTPIFIIAAVTIFFIPNIKWLFICFILFAFLEKYALKKEEIGFNRDEIYYNKLFPKKIYWESLNNVVLKDGILTLDFMSNKVQQFETDELDDEDEEEVTEEEFNAFCQLCLLKNA
jgi:hypothetical protein